MQHDAYKFSNAYWDRITISENNEPNLHLTASLRAIKSTANLYRLPKIETNKMDLWLSSHPLSVSQTLLFLLLLKWTMSSIYLQRRNQEGLSLAPCSTINSKPSQSVKIWHFSKICRPITCLRQAKISQMRKHSLTPGDTLPSTIPQVGCKKDARETDPNMTS